MITIKIPTNGRSEIKVYKDDKLLLTITRKFYFGSKIIGNFFQGEKKIATVSFFFSRIKILFQELDFVIKVKKNGLLSSTFIVGTDEIKIVENPLYFLYPKFYSKLYVNNELIGNVEMRKVLDINGITLYVKLNSNDDNLNNYLIITYLMTCLNVNI